MRPIETIPEMGNKGEWWRRWTQLWYIVRIFVNATTYPQHNNNNKKNGTEVARHNGSYV
jgi:hypothetical protein